MLRPLDCGAEERRKRIRTPWSGMVNDCLADGFHINNCAAEPSHTAAKAYTKTKNSMKGGLLMTLSSVEVQLSIIQYS